MRFDKLLVVVVCFTLAAESARGFQGNEVSVASSTPNATPPASCATLDIVVSVPTPRNYRSAKDYLMITTSIVGSCVDDQIHAQVSVAGNTVHPAAFAVQCDNVITTVTTTSLWYLVPQSQGGIVIPPDSTVDVGVCSNAGGGTTTVTSAQVRVETRR
jgi:hypothetical protein